jgi:hypothetical protein
MEERMTWGALAGFINARDKAFAASLRGASPEEIQRVEAKYGISLPSLYRGFLEMMGRDSGNFSLFGSGQIEAYDDLVARLPDAYYPVERYFRISFPADDAELSASDFFLDLKRGSAADAPIVTCEETQDFRLDDVTEWRFSFGEWVTRQIFSFCVLDRAVERAIVVMGHAAPEPRRSSKDEVVALLGKMKFEQTLPAADRVVCLQRADFGALVDVLADGLGIEIILSAENRRDLEVTIDQLLIVYPDASVTNPDAPSGM